VDTGRHMGYPITTDDLKDFRGATQKNARHNEEHSLSSTPETPTVSYSLHNELVVKLVPIMGAAANVVEQTMRRTLVTSSPSGKKDAITPAFVVQANILTYILSVFALVTLARPVSLINIVFGDIFLPDLMPESERELFNRHDASCSSEAYNLALLIDAPCDELTLSVQLLTYFFDLPMCLRVVPFHVPPDARTSTSGSSTLSCASSRQ